MRSRLLKCLSRAILKHGIRFILNLAPGGQVVYEFGADIWEDYRRDEEVDVLRAEVIALAQAPPDDVRRAVATVVKEQAADQCPEVQHALTRYLAQVPGAIRKSIRPMADRLDATVPVSFSLSGPEDVTRLLLPRIPRFNPGDHPLPGVDWELAELIGVGGFGEVWKARHAHLRSKPPVALKFCLDKSAVAALRNEAGILDRIMQHGQHPGIVPLLNTYLSAEPPCLEYEFVEGGDLAGLIQELKKGNRRSPDTANRLLLRLAEIVASPHRAEPPIVHGDLKPANVLVRRGSNGKVTLRVTDFGIGGLATARAARETKHPTRSRQELLTDAVRGAYSPLYASSQQMTRRPGEAADPRDDVHALGVIWYQLLTGDLGIMSIPPEWKEQVEERGLDPELVRLLRDCIASKAENRLVNDIALSEQLKTVLSRSGIVHAGDQGRKIRPDVRAHLPDEELVLNSLQADWQRFSDAFERDGEKEFLTTTATKRLQVWRTAANKGTFEGQVLLASCLCEGIAAEKDYATALLWWRKAAEQGNPIAQLGLAGMLGEGETEDRNDEEAFRWARRAAEQGFAIAEAYLGWMYLTGPGTPPDEAQADLWLRKSAAWFRQAAEKGNAPAQRNLALMYQTGHGLEKNEQQAFKWYLKSAHQGHAPAQSELAALYLDGQGVAQSYVQAYQWLKKAADQGDAVGQSGLGALFLHGKGVTEDYTQAYQWFKKAADQGNALARYGLGTLFLHGKGVTEDCTRAYHWFKRAADQGEALAQYDLGLLFWEGTGVTQDYSQAYQWFKKAAEQNNTFAQFQVGWMHYSGQGVPQDYSQAYEWYRKAADQGYAATQRELGILFFHGYGVTHDYSRAYQWYKKAADQGYAAAQRELGVCFLGGTGVAQDDAQAYDWFKRAAEQNDRFAQYEIGRLHYSGQGVSQDYSQAYLWFEMAGNQNYALAQQFAGYLCYIGKGIPQDYSQAYLWYKRAADQGHAPAQCELGSLYWSGQGTERDLARAFQWYKKAADQSYAFAQRCLGVLYFNGWGVAMDIDEALRLYRLAADQGDAGAQELLRQYTDVRM